MPTKRIIITADQKKAFIASIVPCAQSCQAQYKVPASITIAQAILESGWGRSELARLCNNYFGIKDTDGENYREFPTTEVDKQGRSKRVIARFEKYDSLESSFKAHAVLLSSANRYQGAMRSATVKGFADGLLFGGYSTDPKYPDKLMDLIDPKAFDLTQYDAPAAQGAKA